MNTLVSITTVTYNSEKTLSKTIESILNQTYTNIEYIIVDGASKDNTVAIAESYKEAFENNGISYKIISEPDEGMYDALNKGIAMCTGDIVGNVNSDDYLELDGIEKVVKCYEETHFDFMYGNINMIYPDGRVKVRKARIRKLVVSRDWNHPSQFATRKLYNRERYVADRKHQIHADFDLLLRVRKSDAKIVILDELISNFRMDGMSHKRSFKDSISRGRERYRIYRDNGYSFLYFFECVMVETGKLLLG